MSDTTKNEIRVKHETAKEYFKQENYPKAFEKIEDIERQFDFLKKKPKLSSSIIKSIATYETQITNGIKAEKKQKIKQEKDKKFSDLRINKVCDYA